MDLEIRHLYQEYNQYAQIFEDRVCEFHQIKNDLQEILCLLDEVVTKDALERVIRSYQEVENHIQKVVIEWEEEVDEEKKIQEETDCIEEKFEEKYEEVSQKEKTSAQVLKQYDSLREQSDDILTSIQQHRKKIQDYLVKIDQIEAREVFVYCSKVIHKGVSFAGKLIRRSIEAKVLENIVPKQVAKFYLAVKLIQDAKNIAQEKEVEVTRKEVDVTYYNELEYDQLDMKEYQSLVKESLVEIKSLQNEYKKICQGFPNDRIYIDTMRDLEDLEEDLLSEALQVEEVICEYNQTKDYHDQK